ncbi:hypothetical protein M1O55_04580 [Dehalococcoidia bacterium]|nr:hypothetical protein [Dehalococcoidia bacterium]
MRRTTYRHHTSSLTRTDYLEAISTFCRENTHLDAVFLAGGMDTPGISDLDFLVVGGSPVISPSVKEFLAGGNVIVMPLDVMPDVNYLERLPLRKLQGTDIALKPNECGEFDVVEIIEWLPERILFLEHQISQPEVDVRRLLLILKSVDRSICGVERHLKIEIPRMAVHNVWHDYASLDLERVTRHFIKKAVEAWDLFQDSFNRLNGEVTGAVSLSPHYTFQNRFPLLMQYLKYVACLDGGFSKRLSRYTRLKGEVHCLSEPLAKLIEFRVNLLDHIYRWYLEKGLTTGMIKYGWILND